MGNGFLNFDEKDWEVCTHDHREWLIFKTLRSMDQRLKALENRTKWGDKACAAIGGVVGGFAAALGLKWWS